MADKTQQPCKCVSSTKATSSFVMADITNGTTDTSVHLDILSLVTVVKPVPQVHVPEVSVVKDNMSKCTDCIQQNKGMILFSTEAQTAIKAFTTSCGTKSAVCTEVSALDLTKVVSVPMTVDGPLTSDCKKKNVTFFKAENASCTGSIDFAYTIKNGALTCSGANCNANLSSNTCMIVDSGKAWPTGAYGYVIACIAGKPYMLGYAAKDTTHTGVNFKSNTLDTGNVAKAEIAKCAGLASKLTDSTVAASTDASGCFGAAPAGCAEKTSTMCSQKPSAGKLSLNELTSNELTTTCIASECNINATSYTEPKCFEYIVKNFFLYTIITNFENFLNFCKVVNGITTRRGLRNLTTSTVLVDTLSVNKISDLPATSTTIPTAVFTIDGSTPTIATSTNVVLETTVIGTKQANSKYLGIMFGFILAILAILG